MPLYSSYGSSYGGSSLYDCPLGGGYDLSGIWRPHSGRHEWVADRYIGPLPGEMGYPYAHGEMYGSPYNETLYHDVYPSHSDHYGAYSSLAMYEEQLRMMQGISEAERRARWQARIQFEELCEEERAMRYALMAEEERMRLGLWRDSYWGSRYGGGRYNLPLSHSAHLSPWSSTRLPLSSSLRSRFSPMYEGSAMGYGMGYPRSAYGGISASDALRNRALLKAEIAEARRLRRHAKENYRQARRMMIAS